MRTLQTLFLTAALTAPALLADEHAAERLNDATTVIQEMTKMDDKGIPQDLIDKAQCVIVVPGLKKAGFIVGAKYGRGYAACRKPAHAGWTAPAAIRIEGGSVGFQIGAAEQDVILLVMNETGQKKLLQSKFTIGGEATAAAGPVGRDATAQTDAQLRAEMLSYSRSRGLFAGISLQGATLRPDESANKELYGRATDNKSILAGNVKAPDSAASFEAALSRQSMRKEG